LCPIAGGEGVLVENGVMIWPMAFWATAGVAASDIKPMTVVLKNIQTRIAALREMGPHPARRTYDACLPP
jgi:hypothetical protein